MNPNIVKSVTIGDATDPDAVGTKPVDASKYDFEVSGNVVSMRDKETKELVLTLRLLEV